MLHSWPPCGINQHYQFTTRDNSWRPHKVSSFHVQDCEAVASWDNVEALPDLQRLELVFRYLPDQDIIAALQKMRGHGRNDFPVATKEMATAIAVLYVAGTARRCCLPTREHRIVVARTAAQPGVVDPLRVRPDTVAKSAQKSPRTCR